MQCNNYSLNGQNLLFFCFNLLKSIIYLLSKLKFDINKREIYELTEKLSREWSIIIQGFKNYKNSSKFVKLRDSKHAQLKLNIVSKRFYHNGFISRKPRIISFSIIPWQAGKDFISQFTWHFRLVSTKKHGYL